MFKPSPCRQLLAEEGENFLVFFGEFRSGFALEGDFIKPLFTLTHFHCGSSKQKVQAWHFPTNFCIFSTQPPRPFLLPLLAFIDLQWCLGKNRILIHCLQRYNWLSGTWRRVASGRNFRMKQKWLLECLCLTVGSYSPNRNLAPPDNYCHALAGWCNMNVWIHRTWGSKIMTCRTREMGGGGGGLKTEMDCFFAWKAVQWCWTRGIRCSDSKKDNLPSVWGALNKPSNSGRLPIN